MLFCAVPIVSPPELLTVKVPIVTPFESAGKSCAGVLVFPWLSVNDKAESAVPLYTKFTPSIKLKPFLIFPVIPGTVYPTAGVNSSFAKTPTSVPPIKNLTVVLLLFCVSNAVTVSNPDLPCCAVYTGPAKVRSVPS